MPSPWLFALRAIPWATLLSNGPAMAKAADTLLSATRARQADVAKAGDDIRALTERVAALERQDRADAEVIKQMSDQIVELTKVTAVLAVRQRWLLIAIGVLFVGLLAVALT